MANLAGSVLWMLPGFFEPPDRLAGEDGGAGGATSGCVTEGTGEAEALFCDAIKGGSFNDRIAIGSGMGVALVVGDAEKNIGPTVRSKL